MDNVLDLHQGLKNYTYEHGDYQAFRINDPKPRHIHKSTVRDRLLHHAVYRILYPYFDKKFIADSYSCRNKKGTHKALNRFKEFGYKVSTNYTRTCWVLKCDIRKFFSNIDHRILLEILKKHITDGRVIWLLQKIIYSFSSKPGKGLPLGNLTSQLFVNLYMDEFDQYVKHSLRVEYYIRYADDFVFLSDDRIFFEQLLPKITSFLKEKLRLEIHPDKVFIKTLSSGIDFLGWVHFPHRRILRTSTKRRMFKKYKLNKSSETEASYLGLLKHGNVYKLKKRLSML